MSVDPNWSNIKMDVSAPSQEVVDQVYGDVASGNFAFTVKAAPSQEPCKYCDGNGAGGAHEDDCEAAPSQEPVAWMNLDAQGGALFFRTNVCHVATTPLFRLPPDAAAQIAELEETKSAYAKEINALLAENAQLKSDLEDVAEFKRLHDECNEAMETAIKVTKELQRQYIQLQAENAELKRQAELAIAALDAKTTVLIDERIVALKAAARAALDGYEHIKTTGIHPSVCADVQRAFVALRDALGESHE